MDMSAAIASATAMVDSIEFIRRGALPVYQLKSALHHIKVGSDGLGDSFVIALRRHQRVPYVMSGWYVMS